MEPYIYVSGEESPTGVTIQLGEDKWGKACILALSECCAQGLKRKNYDTWACDKCGEKSKACGNGSRLPLENLNDYGIDDPERWLRNWVSVWTGYPEDYIKVRVSW